MEVKTFIQTSLHLARKDLLEKVSGLSQDALDWHPAPHANSIGFLVWHMARVEDGWVNRLILRKPHLWVSDGWAKRFAMPEDMRDMGYTYTQEQITAWKSPPVSLLLEYSAAVRAATSALLDGWNPADDGPTVKTGWGKMITVAEVFAQLVWEMNQHGGQVAYIKGLREGLQTPQYMGPLSTP